MQRRIASVCLGVITLFAVDASPFVRHTPQAFLLAGEPIRFDANLIPHFTDRQIRASAEATRAGLVKWAATNHGRMFIARFSSREYEIVVTEDANEAGMGRAPQPGIAALVAARDHSKVKTYELILNPTFTAKSAVSIFPSQQLVTPADMMAAAWAGEMLHIYFYSNGISLPHHQRPEFQREWRLMAAELGMPNMQHVEDEN